MLHEPGCGDVYPDIKPSRYRNLSHVITKVDLPDFIHVLVGLAGLYSRAPISGRERERAQPAHETRLNAEGYSDSKFDQNTVRDSGNVYGLRDLTFT